MRKNFTDILESQKLRELGVPLTTADSFYEWQFTGTDGTGDTGEDIFFLGTNWAHEDVVIPAWSLTALLGMLPHRLKPSHKEYSLLMEKEGEDSWTVSYQSFAGSHLYTTTGTLFDAVYKMLVLLINQKSIKT